MITNTGRNILAKYLIGEASSYASYIAIGVGPKPLAVGEPFPDFSTQTSLDFEVLRMPITSRGYVYDELGNPNIVFAAEIPGDQRYEITEVGLYPGRTNPLAANVDSRMLFNFSESENWEYHTETAALSIPLVVAPLNLDQPSGSIAVTDPVFRTNSNNTLFAGPIRTGLNQRPRFLNRTMIVRGDLSYLANNVTTGNLEISSAGSGYNASHIHFNSVSTNLDANSTDDELRLAFAILNKSDTQSEAVQSVKILIEFAEADVASPVNFARFEVDLTQSQDGIDFTGNRYFVVKKKLSELIKSPGFTWSAVNSARVYASVYQTAQTEPSNNFYVALDGFKLENTTSLNPLYGLTGYSLIKTDDGSPIVKESNTSNIVEFRFGMEVA